MRELVYGRTEEGGMLQKTYSQKSDLVSIKHSWSDLFLYSNRQKEIAYCIIQFKFSQKISSIQTQISEYLRHMILFSHEDWAYNH